MVKVCLLVWAQVIVWLVLAVLTSGSPAQVKGGVSSWGSAVSQMGSSPTSAPQDADDDVDNADSYDYEFGYPSVQVLFLADSAPRKIQKPCKAGYKPVRGKCRRVANIKRQ